MTLTYYSMVVLLRAVVLLLGLASTSLADQATWDARVSALKAKTNGQPTTAGAISYHAPSVRPFDVTTSEGKVKYVFLSHLLRTVLCTRALTPTHCTAPPSPYQRFQKPFLTPPRFRPPRPPHSSLKTLNLRNAP